MQWFRKVFAAGSDGNADLVVAMDAVDYYEAEYQRVREMVRPQYGDRIEGLASKIPGMTEEQYGNLYDLESILEYLEKREKKARAEQLKKYLEHYDRTLNYTVAREYAETSDEVQAIIGSIQNVAAARNQFAGLNKAIETLHFQLSNLTKLRCAGLDDATI